MTSYLFPQWAAAGAGAGAGGRRRCVARTARSDAARRGASRSARESSRAVRAGVRESRFFMCKVQVSDGEAVMFSAQLCIGKLRKLFLVREVKEA